MRQPTAYALFNTDELWLLQSAIRHEMAQQEQWKHPPVSVALNDHVADALVRCEDAGIDEAALLLTRADCLAIDYHVSQGAKSPGGVAIGKQVLMKSFRARRELDEGSQPTVAEPAQPSRDELVDQLKRWQGGQRRKRKV